MSATTAVRSRLDGALLRFRIMAFATGVMLITACSLWIAKAALGGGNHLEPLTGTIWMLHGFLYIVYVLTVLELGLKVRWGLVRIVLVMLAGTIPTMSFVAEHYVTREVRARSAA